MSENLYAQFTGTPMDDGDIEDLLTEQGYGILSLCGERTPYSIPVSVGYDGEFVHFAFLVTGGTATKTAFIDEGAMARLLVMDVRGRFDWQSVAVTGPVQSVDPDGEEWEHFMDVLVSNGWFMKGFERAGSIESIQGWKLPVDSRRGLQRTESPFE